MSEIRQNRLTGESVVIAPERAKRGTNLARADALELLHTVLEKIHRLLGNPPFNLVVRSLGPREKDAAYFHWSIAIVPRGNRTAGFELGTGMFINPMLPDAAAAALREFRP